ncbi:predicted protein [Micromonas commoda]|uniref:Uncharacterized protein n=1 Tax=Micromonas commoda (strain RCC299 / NOUM17 / CCMP2709) TaxID=296587 RepID=C1DYP3_MICCC|nr:predicted protein [Micromonas commoda]ACO60977.1 predicted protein [Micromonas commoda]|eukprot:XP_002499719.1 predicted protein [Micromonas commoda]
MAQGGDTLPSLMDVARREAHSELAMSPALLAFNRYQEQQREELKNPSALAAARDELKGRDKGESPGVEDEANVELRLEKLIGKRWKNLDRETRDKLVAEARGEQAKLIAEGGVPAPSNSGRGSKSKRAASKRAAPGPDGAPVAKRKPGRPRKVPSAQLDAPLDAQLAPGGAPPARPRTTAATGGARVPVFVSAHQPHVTPQPVGPWPPVRVTSLEGPLRPVPPGGEDLRGHVVEGVVDGAFDAGYFLTVRANGCLLRGIIWREEECLRAVGANAQAKKLQNR